MTEKKATPVAGDKQCGCGCGCIGADQKDGKARQPEADKPNQKKN